MESPSPYQARVIRLVNEGCKLEYLGRGRATVYPPGGIDHEEWKEWDERIKEEVGSRRRQVPKATIDAMIRKKILDHHTEEREARYGDYTITDHTLEVTSEAELWLLDAKPSDFESPEGDTPEFDAEEIRALLRERHAGSGWAFFEEFTAGTGRYANSRWDAFAIALWESKGYVRIVYEIKVYRSDFIKELKNPSKQARALKFANKFFYAAPEGLIDPDELPDNCGLIEAVETPKLGRHLRIKKNPPPMDAPDFPMWFVAAIMRRVDWAEYDDKLRRKANAMVAGYEPIMSSLINHRDDPEAIVRTVKYWFTNARTELSARLVRDYLDRYNKVIIPAEAEVED